MASVSTHKQSKREINGKEKWIIIIVIYADGKENKIK
jgi:hypothetical protein